jgi:abhydrolase domain-containing protein 12
MLKLLIFVLFVYFVRYSITKTLLSSLLLFPALQPFVCYLHWIRYPFIHNYNHTSAYGLSSKNVKNLRLDTLDGGYVGAWHISPIKNISNQIHDCDRVYIYLHGNAGNRASGYRPSFYRVLF